MAEKLLHGNMLSSITGLVALNLLIIFTLLPSALGAQDDLWFDSLKDAKGMKVGSRVPRFGDLERAVRTGAPETPSADAGETETRGQGHKEAIDPSSVDPKKADIARLIREWISVAEPPENATEGAKFRYDQWGRKIGTTADGGIISATSKPDYALASPETTVWSLRTKLDSVNHCTVEEYVVGKLSDKSMENCRGRYKTPEEITVTNLTGLPLSDAEKKLDQAGLKPRLVPGKAALSKPDEGKIASQDPGPGAKLKRGASVTLEVYGPVRPEVLVPSIVGLSPSDAKAKLERQGLKALLVALGPAPSDDLSFKVKEAQPQPGSKAAPGTEVVVKVYGKHSPPLIAVPEVEALSFSDAKSRLTIAGLKVSPLSAGPAPSEEKSFQVKTQEPPAGTKVTPGSGVKVYVFSQYVHSIVVPDVRGLSYLDARKKLEAAGLIIDGRDAGRPAERRFADTAQKQEPSAGTRASQGTPVLVWVYGPYAATREEQVAATDCSRYPGSRAYWDNNAGKPLCGCFDGLQWNLAKTQCAAPPIPQPVGGELPLPDLQCPAFVVLFKHDRCVGRLENPPPVGSRLPLDRERSGHKNSPGAVEYGRYNFQCYYRLGPTFTNFIFIRWNHSGFQRPVFLQRCEERREGGQFGGNYYFYSPTHHVEAMLNGNCFDPQGNAALARKLISQVQPFAKPCRDTGRP